jgi:predicted TIM-barrel fold metal-dependent hydrolase
VPPIDLVRRHVRFTLQPVDAPPGDIFGRILEHLGGDDLLLFSTDYPHWQFDGNEVLPEALRGDLAHKIMVENPRKTYPRIEEAVR